MAGPGIRVLGADRASATLRTAEQRIEAITEDPELARPVLEAIRPLIPVRSGRLRGSARVAPVDGSSGVVVGEVYAGPINYGWPAHGIEGVHYLEDGAEAAEPALERQLERKAQQILDNVKGA